MSNNLRRCLTIIVGLSLQFVGASPVVAQASAAAPRAFCFRGKLAPKCKWFMLTELGVDFNVIGKPVDVATYALGDGRTYTQQWKPTAIAVNGAVGLMRNVGQMNALGAVVTALPGPDGPLLGVKARYRRWLTPDLWSLDVGAGINAGTADISIRNEAPPGFSADIALTRNDYFGVTARFELLRGNGKPRPLLYTGVKVGGLPALGLGALLGTAVIAILGAAGG